MFRPRPSSAQASANRQTYIPPHIEQAMNQHMQATMPANLRQYAGGGYVPQKAQAEMTRYMEKSMPTHLKQYAGAYMQQRVIDPGNAQPGAVAQPIPGGSPTGSPLGNHPPVPDMLRRSHSMPGVEQAWVDPNTLPNSAGPFQPDQPAAAGAPAQTGYDFILNPPPAPRQKVNLPGSSSLLGRVLVVGGGLLVLIIVFSIVKGLLSGNNFPQYAAVAEDQQALIHLSTNATSSTNGSNNNNLSDQTENFAATVLLTMRSAENDTLTYLAANKFSVNSQTLVLKESAGIDQQLTTAATNNTYDPMFRSIMQTALKSYVNDIKTAYNSTTATPGRTLLKQQYAGAQLLLRQLSLAGSTS